MDLCITLLCTKIFINKEENNIKITSEQGMLSALICIVNSIFDVRMCFM